MLDEATIAALKDKHGEIFKITHDGSEAVFKRPTKDIYRRFKASVQQEARRLDATERLVYDCLVYPETAAFAALVEQRPAIIDTFAGELLEIAGTAKDAEVVPL